MAESPYVDVHSHAHEYSVDELENMLRDVSMVIVVVSGDYASSLRTLELSQRLKGLIPCVGVHPWTVNELGSRAIEEAKKVVELALSRGARCLGEIGLDTKFVGQSIELQRKVFKVFLEAARDNGLILNLHTAGTWREVFEELMRYDIGYANFHWYTGPQDLLKSIVDAGFTISINPAVKIQRKHREIVRIAPLEAMLTESDAPYNYKGLKLHPLMVKDVVREIATIKGLDEGMVRETLYATFVKKWV